MNRQSDQVYETKYWNFCESRSFYIKKFAGMKSLFEINEQHNIKIFIRLKHMHRFSANDKKTTEENKMKAPIWNCDLWFIFVTMQLESEIHCSSACFERWHSISMVSANWMLHYQCKRTQMLSLAQRVSEQNLRKCLYLYTLNVN